MFQNIPSEVRYLSDQRLTIASSNNALLNRRSVYGFMLSIFPILFANNFLVYLLFIFTLFL